MSATADAIASLTGVEVAPVRRQKDGRRAICWIRSITGILQQLFFIGSRGIFLHEDQKYYWHLQQLFLHRQQGNIPP
jgi:hypothetical protein